MKPVKNSLTDVDTSTILDSISDGVFTVDHNFIITSFNRAAEGITGYSRAEAIGRRCSAIFNSNLCANHCPLHTTLAEKRSLFSVPARITNRDGESVPVSVATSLLRDLNGAVQGGVETFRDLTLIEGLRRKLEGTVKLANMVSRNTEMKRIFSILPQVGNSDSPVLIEGETGTGKELLSRALHLHSKRSERRFVAINCGALPDNLLESELFGYKAGAFTGARRDKPGIFASAGRGTILLDEVGDTSPAFQVKLLRLLEEREFQPLGSTTTVRCEARILAATNRNLAEMVEAGTFRQDLYYRINVIHLRLPPLRDRIEDIPLLVERFIDKYRGLGTGRAGEISPEAMSLLLSHTYPGNIRELENILERAFVLRPEGPIEPHHLPPALAPENREKIPIAGTDREDGLRCHVEQTERDIIVDTLARHRYNRTAAARSLGMHKSTLYRKMARLGIAMPQKDGRSAAIATTPLAK